ncbi:bifunctional riboflavin kinase/FAD synthetase [Algicola sagamiensis]|uniref:bifunctional riboflavin kinase/FAD synthetase n=1 Tax=Algicola sagamiensis TaxID=163869 RepID=UPI00036E8600|nr:bifunctional riboflavin kinase/FAD synthetase [Algicola sagamiensis]
MELIRGIHNIRQSHQGCVLTIGNFDGVHSGHQQVLGGLHAQASQLNLPATVMIFEPQPQELFQKGQAPARLCNLREKYTALKEQGVDRLIVVQFNAAFSQMKAQEFVQELLVKKLGVRFLIVGDDFRFGQGREGNFDMLQHSAEQFGFGVRSTQSYRCHDSRVSSTEIRRLLQLGDLSFVEDMLGRPYTLLGRVSHGDKKGREFGFPTANVRLKRLVSPVTGVYAVTIRLARENREVTGVANIGRRPTMAGNELRLEVHLFDFDADLYGQIIEVTLKHKIRDETKFESIAALKSQIANDVVVAKTWFTTQINA